MKIVKFERSGSFDIKDMLEHEMKHIDETENMIIIPILKDGSFSVGHTHMEYTRIIGILEVMKQTFVNEINET